MKNEIREAYDRMNPSTEAKERMMRNMMKKEKSVRAYGPVQDSYGWWSAVPAMLLLVVILAVGWKVILPGGESPLTDNPVATATPTDQATPDNSFAENLIAEGYAHVLEKYIQAHKENWTPEEYSNNDMSYVLGMKESIWEYGYALLDLNGDQVDELLITDGELIIDLYALLEGGSVNHLLSGGERMRYFLCEDNIIGYHGSGGASNTLWSFDRLQPNGEFQYEVQLEFDTDTWYKFTNSGTETPGGVDVLSPEQAEQLIAGYAPVEIIYQSFLRPETEKTGDTAETIPAGYSHVLDKYVNATTEEWTKEQYMRNDISYLVASKNIYWQYGYAQIDLNGDGSKELIITDGEEIYDVYMLMADGGAGHIISATENRTYSLCKDNIIGCHSFGGELDSSWDFSRLLPGGDSEIVMYLQKNDNVWSKMEGGTDKLKTISHEEADELIGSTYWHVEIPFQPILSLEPAEELIYPRSYVQLLRELIEEYSGIATMDVAFADVTGDGKDELLLGLRDNDSFGHVYSIVDGQVEEILTYGKDIDFSLCKDGVICDHTPEEPFDNYVFISLKDNAYKILDTFAYAEKEKSWARTTNGTRENISDAEMKEIIDSYGSVSLEWVSVMEVANGT